MRKILYILPLLAAALAACQEWDPVLTAEYEDPGLYQPASLTPNTTIAQLKARYTKTGQPVKITEDLLIGGKVISEDRSGNIYRSLYIQDESGAIELKIGKSGLYNDYKPGQMVYVKCSGLSLGSYNGMLQLGYQDPTGEYETAYLDADYLISTHIFRGPVESPVQPRELGEDEVLAALKNIPQSPLWGSLVTLKGLRYGCKPDKYTGATEKIFCLLYVDPARNKKDKANRVFLSDGTYGVNTWALSKSGMSRYLLGGNFDSADTGDGVSILQKREGESLSIKEQLLQNAAAYAVSHYFLMGNTEVQVRSSGYSKFADAPIDPAILEGGARADITGILTTYNNEVQFTLIDLGGVRLAQ